MNKQAEYYEKTGDSLKGEKALQSYRAAQNHLQPTDPGYMQDLKRIQDKILSTSTATWGGSREGAGRPSTGRKRQSFYITEEENEKLREYLEELRNPSKQLKTR